MMEILEIGMICMIAITCVSFGIIFLTIPRTRIMDADGKVWLG